jgi:hypothetical protein
MWVVFIPMAILLFIALLAAAYFFARRDVGSGPNPNDVNHVHEP